MALAVGGDARAATSLATRTLGTSWTSSACLRSPGKPGSRSSPCSESRGVRATMAQAACSVYNEARRTSGAPNRATEQQPGPSSGRARSASTCRRPGRGDRRGHHGRRRRQHRTSVGPVGDPISETWRSSSGARRSRWSASRLPLPVAPCRPPGARDRLDFPGPARAGRTWRSWCGRGGWPGPNRVLP